MHLLPRNQNHQPSKKKNHSARTTMRQVLIAAIAPLAGFSTIGITNLAFATPTFAQVQQEQTVRTLTVTGLGDRPVEPTKAQISLGIEIAAPTAQQVQEAIAQRSNQLVDKLRELNVEKLQTTNISLNPRYVYEDNLRRQEGFIGSNTVSFLIPIDRAGEALDAAVSTGANKIESISFAATPTAIATARNLALQDAVDDARSQADVVLSKLGYTARSIRTVVIGNAATPSPIPLNTANLATAELRAAPTPVIGGEQRVQATVTLEIIY
jgi:uncharacterized protein YggE